MRFKTVHFDKKKKKKKKNQKSTKSRVGQSQVCNLGTIHSSVLKFGS